MKFGIACTKKLKIENIYAGGFEYAEIPYELTAYLKGQTVSGVSIHLDKLAETGIANACDAVKSLGGSYLLIETYGVGEHMLDDIVSGSAAELANKELEIYIENGAVGDDISGYTYGPYSDSRELRKLADKYNEMCGRDRFGISLNLGYMNLISKSYRSQIYYAGSSLRHIHINDNDSVHNDRQLPYTYTRGRGALTTDWTGAVGQLISGRYDGWMIFDTTGTWNRLPERLQPSFVRLERSLADEWMSQYNFERDVLGIEGRRLVLFGAGVMMRNYLQAFGDKYPPEMAVDNSPDKWGTCVDGVRIEDPQKIMEIPEDERTVLICSGYYTQIGSQLRSMGVQYSNYMDLYYII